MYQCKHCYKQFENKYSLNGHMRMHGNRLGKLFNPKCSIVITKDVICAKDLDHYFNSFISCKNCNKSFKPKYNKKFCGHSCSASFINKIRPSIKVATKLIPCSNCKTLIKCDGRVSHKVCGTCAIKRKETKKIFKMPNVEIMGLYSKLYINKCQHCNFFTCNRKKRKYCNSCCDKYSTSNKKGFKFTFNVFNYPDLFDLSLIQDKGFFSPGGKSGKWNITGISRDHKISITDAIKNKYDSYYISHPCNCQLIPQSENAKKHIKSSITYSQLIKQVNEYDLK